MAFAAMDFIYHGRHDLARVFCDAYLSACDDHEGRALLDLYIAYRALVRAYVDGMKAQETEVPLAERQRAQASSEAHWLLALRQLEQARRRTCLLLVGGLPGTGKSTLARALAEREGFHLIRSDEIRKNIASEWRKQNPSERASLYSDEWTRRTYMMCCSSARHHLWLGARVLIDATFRQESHRRLLLEMADRLRVPAGLLICQADAAVVQSRLALRKNDASDADWSVHEQLAALWESLGPESAARMITIDTSGEVETSIQQARNALSRLG
jgi:predicted kinase